MGEYAYDFTGENVHDGPSRNPHDTAHMTGGSSGGSGGGGGRRAGADRARLRHQRLDPRARLVLRPVRSEADLRPPVARPHLPVRGEPRSSGAAGAHHRGPGARLRRHAGPRSRGPRLHRATARAGAADDRAGCRRPAHRRRRRLFQARRLARGAGRRGAGRQGAGRHPRDRDPRGRPRPCRRLRHHHQPRAPPCTSTACARGRGISSPPSAIA